jgi:hypothetical protein
MLASMVAERVLIMREGDMARANQLQGWTVVLALLAGAEFSYAHLRQIGLWAVELVAQSVWRLACALASLVFPAGNAWIAPAALAVFVLLTWGLAAWSNGNGSSRGFEERER